MSSSKIEDRALWGIFKEVNMKIVQTSEYFIFDSFKYSYVQFEIESHIRTFLINRI